MPATFMGCTRMKAPSSEAVAQTGSSSGSSRFLPAMFEPICTPRRPSSVMAWRSSSAACLRRLHRQRGDPQESAGMGLHQLGELLVLDARERRRQRRRLRIEEGLRADRQHLHVDLGGRHVARGAARGPSRRAGNAGRRCRPRRACRTARRRRSASAPPWAIPAAAAGSSLRSGCERERRSSVWSWVRCSGGSGRHRRRPQD